MNPPADSILIFFALPEEARPFRKLAAAAAGPGRAQVVVTGMGARNAGRVARATLAADRPALVLTCGYAGGLNPALPPLTLVFSADAPERVATALGTLGARAGRFHCAPRVAITAAEKRVLFAETGADAVEMESGVIRRICGELGIPCVTLRVISDAANEDLPLDFNRLTTPEQNLSFAKLAWAVATAPGKIPALLALGKRTSAAAGKLGAALEQLLRALG